MKWFDANGTDVDAYPERAFRGGVYEAQKPRKRQMSTKHTPGPWRVGDAGHTVFGPPNGQPSPPTIASVATGTGSLKANARLIAKAPEMLELLERARRNLAQIGLIERNSQWDQDVAKLLALTAND